MICSSLRSPCFPGLFAASCLLALAASPLHAAPPERESNANRKTGEQATAVANAAILAAVGQGSLLMVEPTLTSADVKLKARKPGAQSASARRVQYLVIGDSLSVGAFGEAMIPYLARKSQGRVALFASCGSAPEHWLAGEPDHSTRCGFRKYVPDPSRREYLDFHNGHAPAAHATPKIEDLLREYRPATVIVQLGTNWMDILEAKGLTGSAPRLGETMDRFARAVRGTLDYKPTLIWVSPPDSSKFSRSTEQGVLKIIRDAASRNGFRVIDCSTMISYRNGVTGGDGVHLNKEASYDWARQVQKRL